MLFEIRHFTRYEYDSPVFLQTQSLRLKPRSDAGQRLVSFRLDMDPQPAGWTENVDLEGNDVIVAWFGDRSPHLTLATTAVVDTLRLNPFDYVWLGDRTLPVKYRPELAQQLAIYRSGETSPGLRDLGARVLHAVNGDAGAFPMRLTQDLHAGIRRVVRPDGDPRGGEETLALGEGSCRDQTVLFMEICRAFGYAARFVSGYYYASDDLDSQELHAWAELYLPDGGWRGFDPTNGLAAGQHHIAVAAGALPWQAAPVSGTYRGRGRSTLTANVEIEQLPEG